MAETIEALVVRIEADVSPLKQGLAQAEVETRRAGVAMNKAVQPTETAFARVDRAAGRIGDSIVRSGEQARDATRAMRDFSHAIGTAFEDAVVEGLRLSEVVKALEKDIFRILTRVLVTKPLEEFLTGAASSLFSGGSFGGGAAVPVSGSVDLAGALHQGGIAGRDGAPRVVDPRWFTNAPRLHGGGIMALNPRLGPDEVPAILRRGEVVRTPEQEAALGRRTGRPGIEHAPFRREGGGGVTVINHFVAPALPSRPESQNQLAARVVMALRQGTRNL